MYLNITNESPHLYLPSFSISVPRSHCYLNLSDSNCNIEFKYTCIVLFLLPFNKMSNVNNYIEAL